MGSTNYSLLLIHSALLCACIFMLSQQLNSLNCGVLEDIAHKVGVFFGERETAIVGASAVLPLQETGEVLADPARCGASCAR